MQATVVEKPTRDLRGIAMGIIAIMAAAGMIILALGTQGEQSTFVLTSQRAGITIAAPDVVVPTFVSLIVLGVVSGVAGFWQVFRGFKKGDWVVIFVAALAVLAFLVWATRGKSLNMTGMFVSSLVRATPIALAALSGIYSERSGVVNIGIEGMMLVGSFTSVVFASVSGNMLIGVIGGILAGVLLAALHAVLSIKYRVNQIVSGAGIIILALGLTSYLQRSILNIFPHLNAPGPAIAAFPIPGLWQIPVLGPVVFNLSPIIYTLFALLIITQILMNRTRWGLRVRSVGEHPKAADTLGINVFRVRYWVGGYLYEHWRCWSLQ
jgi:simple sugar transport system permease protein